MSTPTETMRNFNLGREAVGPITLANGKRDWTLYNATIVGYAPNPRAPDHPRHGPGLEATQGLHANPLPYKPVSFAAQCEWPDNEIGWQRVTRGGRGRRRGGGGSSKRIV